MKPLLLAAVLALVPAAASALVPTERQAFSQSVFEEKKTLFDDIESWRAMQLPHLNPPAQLTVLFEPRLNAIKAAVKAASSESELTSPRAEFVSWKQELLRDKFETARAEGLARGSFEQYAGLETHMAQFSADLHAAIVKQNDVARSFAPARQRTASAAVQDPSAFFDGTRDIRGAEPADVWAPPPPGADDPARYSKVRQILISQGASKRIVDMAIREALRQHADPLLVLAVIQQESDFHAHATSYKRDLDGNLILDDDGRRIPLARGLMQIMAATGRGLGVATTAALYDPQTNLRAGIRYMNYLWGNYVGGDMTGIAEISNPLKSRAVKSAVAAYNAGPGAVHKYGGVPPYRETQGYVKSVLAYYRLFKGYMNA